MSAFIPAAAPLVLTAVPPSSAALSARRSSRSLGRPPLRPPSRPPSRATLAAPSSPSSPTSPSQPPAEDEPLLPGALLSITTPEQYDTLAQHAADDDALVVLDFMAAWCRKCTYLVGVVKKLARQFPNVYFIKVDVNKMKRLPAQFGIRNVPTFVFVHRLNVVDTFVAAEKPTVVSERLKTILNTLIRRL
ncbi:unnamed protein product [Agarophyton chilense]